MERFAELELPNVDEGTVVPSDRLNAIRRQVHELSSNPREGVVDQLWEALVACRGDPGLPALIHELLEMSSTQYLRDRHGNTLRFVLVDTLLDLGFPHALEVKPEDLAYHRGESPLTSNRGSVLAGLTFALGLGSLAWNGLFLFLLAVVHEREFNWVALPLLLGLAHGGTALVQTARVINGKPDKTWLRWLGGAGGIGLAAVVAAELQKSGSGVFALIVAAGSLLTALGCAFTAARVTKTAASQT